VVDEGSPVGLLVKADVAWNQIESERPAPVPASTDNTQTPAATTIGAPAATPTVTPALDPAEARKPRRFHGTVELDPQRVGRDAGKIAEEVIAHLPSLVGGEVTVRLDIDATSSSEDPDNAVRIVTENCRTLKFTSQGFESD